MVSCASLRSKQIVGRWDEVGTSTIGVFHEDGTVELTSSLTQVTGAYGFIDSKRLKIHWLDPNGKPLRPEIYEVAISSNHMVWRDYSGNSTEFRKIK